MTSTPITRGKPKSTRLFRFGFIAYPKDEYPLEEWRTHSRDWISFTQNEIVFQLHPEAKHSLWPGLVLIGDVYTIGGTLSELIPAHGWERLSGRFGLFDLVKMQIRADPFGAQSLYYCSGRGAVASHSEILSIAYGHERSSTMAGLVQMPEYVSRSVKYLPGDSTMFEGVRALPPNHLYDLCSNKVLRFWPHAPRVRTTFDDWFAVLDESLSALSGAVERPIIGITGGIDTRLIVVAYGSRGIAFQGVTWGGAWCKPVERPVIGALIAHYGIPHKWVIPAADSLDNAFSRLAGRNSGGFRGRSKLTADMSRAFDCGTFIRGYGGEIMRGFYNLTRSPMAENTPLEMVKAYGSSMKAREPSAQYFKTTLREFEGFHERADYSDLKGFDVNDIFYWEHRMGMWGAAMHNEMDPAVRKYNRPQRASTLRSGPRATR